MLLGVVVQALLGVELGQLLQALGGVGIQLGDLFVDRDGFYGEAFGGVDVAHPLEEDRRLVVVAHPRVQVADGVQDGQVLGVFLDYLFVFIDGVLQLALLHRLFGCRQNFLLVEPEAKCHMGTVYCLPLLS